VAEIRIKVSLLAHIYTWAFILCFSLSPLLITVFYASQTGLSTQQLFVSVFSVISIQAVFLYIQYRCSNENLSYLDGLLIITSCMMTGWAFISLFVVFPALLIALLSSFAIAVYGDINHSSKETPLRFRKLLMHFYEHRMHQ